MSNPATLNPAGLAWSVCARRTPVMTDIVSAPWRRAAEPARATRQPGRPRWLGCRVGVDGRLWQPRYPEGTGSPAGRPGGRIESHRARPPRGALRFGSPEGHGLRFPLPAECAPHCRSSGSAALTPLREGPLGGCSRVRMPQLLRLPERGLPRRSRECSARRVRAGPRGRRPGGFPPGSGQCCCCLFQAADVSVLARKGLPRRVGAPRIPDRLGGRRVCR